MRPELAAPAAKRAERRLIQLLAEGEGFRQRLAAELREAAVHRGLSTEKLFEALIEACVAGDRPDPVALGESLEAPERRLLYDVLFEPAAEPTWDEAWSCLTALRRVRLETELADLQRRIEAGPAAEELRHLMARKLELRRALAAEAAH